MKGFFTQGGALLLKHKIDLSELEPLLQDFAESRRVTDDPTDSPTDWMMGGDRLIVSLKMDNNAAAAIDVVPQPWPDSMGDPKSDAMLFASWSMGHFGPLAWPGGLERAIDHAWSWPEGRVPTSHAATPRSFVLRSATPLAPAQMNRCDPRITMQ